MSKIDLKLTATGPNAEVTTTTISYANPNATNAELLNFTRALNNLTQNTYGDTQKVTTTNLDTEGTKQQAILTLSTTTITTANLVSQSRNISYTYNGDGTVYISETNQDPGTITYRVHGNTLTVNGGSGPNPCTLTLYSSETDNYTAASATLDIVLQN